MIDPLTGILGGIIIAGISVAGGKYMGANGKVTDEHCTERQKACSALVLSKLDNLENLINKAIANKTISL